MINYTRYDELRSDLELGEITCDQIVAYHLSVINDRNPEIGAFLEVFEEEARTLAQKIDQKIKDGTAGKLAGLVVGIKDLFCYKGHTLTCASKILDGFESQITSTAIQRLIDEDAIIIGRQNCDEFAMGSSNENSAYSIPVNPLDTSRVCGGSSGGSAAAVAANMCQVSIGSDTGGSIRQPAAFCGVVGLKPTYSRISRYGLTAYASSFDCPGPITKSVEDALLVTEVMSGFDPKDSTSSKMPFLSEKKTEVSDKRKIAYIKELQDAEGISRDVQVSYQQFVDDLKSAGHTLHEVSFPYLEELLPVYYILTSAEASTNLSRYDGIRYGHRSESGEGLESLYKQSRTEGFGEEVLRRIMLGTFVLSASYHDAYFTKAQKARRLIRDHTQNILAHHDFIVMPTTPTTAFKIGDKTEDPVSMYMSDIFTVQASVSGLPAVSLPVGKGDDEMPIGMQIIGDHFSESSLLEFSKDILPS